jgi:hypothetical protein
MKRFISIILAVCALSLGTIYLNLLWAADTKENTQIVPARTPMSDDDAWISSMALKAWRNIVNARSDLHGKDVVRAQEELKQAHSTLDIIEAMNPTAKIKDRLWITENHLRYEDAKTGLRDLADLYTALNDMDYLTPMDEPRIHINKAREYLVKGDKENAMEELRAANAAVFYAELDLPLVDTRRHVTNAQALLTKGNIKEADAESKSAEDGVQFISAMNIFPVTQARRSLLLAQRNYAAGKLETARADLRDSMAYLEKEATTTEAEARTDVKSLINDIGVVESKIQKFDRETEHEIERLYGRAKTLAVGALKTFQSEDRRGK